jgi:hypothetical protein
LAKGEGEERKGRKGKGRGRRWKEMKKKRIGVEKGKQGNRGLSELVLGQNGEGVKYQ